MSTIKEQLGAYLSKEGLRPEDKPYGFHFNFEDLSYPSIPQPDAPWYFRCGR